MHDGWGTYMSATAKAVTSTGTVPVRALFCKYLRRPALTTRRRQRSISHQRVGKSYQSTR
jgi:hypothetical protein